MRQLPDHPDIEWTLRTGYPSWMQPKRDLDVDDEYSTEDYEELEDYYDE